MRLIDADRLWEEQASEKCAGNCSYCDKCYEANNWHCGLIEDQPTVDPVKHGRWISRYVDASDCSVCGATFDFEDTDDKFDYCPRCGAKMDEVSEK